eukprot:3222487-Rhodomonas_salina.1
MQTGRVRVLFEDGEVRYPLRTSSYAISATSLRTRYGMCGTELAYGATRSPGPAYYRRSGVLRSRALAAYAPAARSPVLTWRMVPFQIAKIGKWGWYYPSTGLGVCYAVSSTEIAYHALWPLVLTQPMLLRVCYAMSGTERGYAAIRCLVLTEAVLLCDVWY